MSRRGASAAVGRRESYGRKSLRLLGIILFAAVCVCPAVGQKPAPIPSAQVVQEVRDYRMDHEDRIVRELAEFLSIPNVASDTPNIQKNAEHLREMRTYLELNKNLFGADLLITADGPVHQSGRQLVFFGNRGDIGLDITVYGPVRALHSGHYGNWAPNPAMELARLLAAMKDADGRVLIDGYYDDVTPLSDLEKKALAEMPVNDADLEAE